jgi:hypothetical protein
MADSGLMWFAILLAGLGLMALPAARRPRRHDLLLAAEVRRLQKQLADLHGQVAATLQRFDRVEQVLQRKVAAPVTTRTEAVPPAYALAARLARRGISPEELMEACGLTRGEVELITTISRHDTAAGAAARAPR